MPALDLDTFNQFKYAVETLRLASPEHQEKAERLSPQHMMNARFPFTAFENVHVYRNGALADVQTREITVLGFDVNPDDAYATAPTGHFQTGRGDEQETFRGDPSFYYPTRADAESDAAVELAKSRKKAAQTLVDQHLPKILPALIEMAEKPFKMKSLNLQNLGLVDDEPRKTGNSADPGRSLDRARADPESGW